METGPNRAYYDILLEKKIQAEFKLADGLKVKNQTTLNGRIRIYDGEKWYVSNYVGANIEKLIQEAQGLLEICKPQSQINITKYRTILGKDNINCNDFPLENYEKVSKADKIRSLKSFQRGLPELTEVLYHDLYIEKYFVSEGINRFYNFQSYEIGVRMIEEGESVDLCRKSYDSFQEMEAGYKDFIDYCNRVNDHKKSPNCINQANYSVILAPEVLGVVVNHCIGQNYELEMKSTDLQGNIKNECKDWNGNKQGEVRQLQYCPFDDDGIIKTKTPIVNGTALGHYIRDLQEALKVQFSSNILSVEELFKGFTGIYVMTADHGEINKNGELVIIPRVCKQVDEGLLAEFVKVSKIKMKTSELFNAIEAIGDEMDFSYRIIREEDQISKNSFLIAQGGPHVLVRGMECQ